MTYTDIPPHIADPDAYLAEEALLAEVRTGSWLDSQQFPPVHFIVNGLLPEGMTILAGPPKAGKSFLVYGVALACAAGRPALGCLPVSERVEVLYLALEDGHRRVQSRSRKAAKGHPLPESFHYLTRVAAGTSLATIRAWIRRRTDPSRLLVIVDTAAKVRPIVGGNANMYQEDYRFGAALKAIADDHPGLAVVVVTHTRKSASVDFVESVSGTNGLTGAADTILTLARVRGTQEGTLSITGRDVAEGEYRLTALERGGWELVGGSLTAAADAQQQARVSDNLGENSAAIVEHIRVHPGSGPKEVALAMGLEANQARSILSRLTTAGRLVRTGRGVYLVPKATDAT